MTTSAAHESAAQEPAASILAGGTFAAVAGLDADDLEAIYHLGYNQYEQEQYAEAERAFQVLCFHDHLSPRFWLSLGAARQQLKDYAGAIMAYSMIPETGSANPLAPLRAAECYIALGLFEEAVSGLEAALDWADNGGDRQGVIRHVEILFQALEQMLAADGEAVEGDAR
jgi:type III secretion system low calcium response chaperone LcrH/SycD